MIEKFLIDSGLKCGTLKNFNTQILEDARRGNTNHWYFLTPLKVVDKGGNGYKEVVINLAYPINAIQADLTEQDAINRISEFKEQYESNLLTYLKKYMNVPTYDFKVIPFWSNDKTPRTERTDFANVKIHILNAVLTIRYRDSWFGCKCN
jgi:hypothetical protein